MVVRRGVNDHCVLPMAEHFRRAGHTLRFIEYMDVGMSNRWRLEDVVPAGEIVTAIDRRAGRCRPATRPTRRGGDALPLSRRPGGDRAHRLRPTHPFCGSCTRARLSADGRLHTCLFAADGHDLRAVLRGGADDEHLAGHVHEIWAARADRYSEVRAGVGSHGSRAEMSYLGG